ncbi:MAG TPA: isoquinoline 1-oxidoreductase [Maritimibacter sp.]|nr:isoquinoline 1-oxidoreductase [Maritimibacter sp.]
MGKLGKITRRAFLVGAVAVTGGVAVGAYVLTRDPKNPLDPERGATLNSYVIVDQSGVTIIVPRAEMGQGVQTSLAALVAEELEVPLDQVRVEHGPPAAAYATTVMMTPREYDAEPQGEMVSSLMAGMTRLLGMQVTGGSTSALDAFDKMRISGAAAREMLIDAAAQRLGVGRDQLRAEAGEIIATDGTRLTYAELAADAASLTPPDNPPLKKPEDWVLIGKSQPKLDQPAKATGTAPFALDTRSDGMKFATVKMNPRIGAALNSFDASEAQGMAGVEEIFAIDGGVAVVANNTWLAMQAAEAITFDWAEADHGATTEEIFADIEAAFDLDPNVTARDEGEVTTPDDALTAEYRAPFLSHAPMEPMNATVLFTGDRLEIWAGVQGPIITRKQAADIVGLKDDDVTVHTTIMGGSFGRRGFNDFVLQAVQVAREMPGTPINMTWSREEDMRHDYYRPGAIARLSAGLNQNGMMDNLRGQFASASVMRASLKAFTGRDLSTPDTLITEGCADQPYAIENALVTGHVPERSPRIGFWRSVGHSMNAFFWESFVDEMAHKAGMDPLAFRLAHIEPEHAPTAQVLKTVAEMANWTGETPAGKGRGIAVTYSFGTPVAEIVEISDRDGDISIDKVWIAADLGKIIDPGNVEAQLIGGAIYGLSAALYGEITFEDGGVVEGNFYDYDALRMSNTPDFEVQALALGGPVGGVGEPGTPPAAPALANAIFDLTGERIRELPLRKTLSFVA